MVLFSSAFWVSVSTLLVALFSLFSQVFLRIRKSSGALTKPSSRSTRLLEKDEQNNSDIVEPEAANLEEIEFEDSHINHLEEEVIPETNTEKNLFDEGDSRTLIFKFPSYEEFLQRNKVNSHDSFASDMNVTPSMTTDRCELSVEKGNSGSVEKPEVLNREVFCDNQFSSKGNLIERATKEETVLGYCAEKDCEEHEFDEGHTGLIEKPEVFVIKGNHANMFLSKDGFTPQDSKAEGILNESADKESKEADLKKTKAEEYSEVSFTKEEEALGAEKKTAIDGDFSQILSEKDLSTLDSDTESVISSHEFSLLSQLADSYSDGFLSDKEFESSFELQNLMDLMGRMEMEKLTEDDDLDLEEMEMQRSSPNWHESENFDEEDSDLMEELKDLEEPQVAKESKNFEKDEPGKNKNLADEPDLPHSHNSSTYDSENPSDLESLWEHHELLDQLKMEINKVRATGLPTIHEEFETPKIMEDLKPWKIDEKFYQEDTMDELHKFYQSYRERMRKFDILNYQKMYAIGLLQKKDPLKSITICKSSTSPAFSSLVLDNLRLCKPKKSQVDPVMKFIRELCSDLEVIYVGHMCLSWEILHWQYEKALELWEADSYQIQRYNVVAGEFQQFQVFLQRFLENEPFEEGARIQRYIKNRCVTRSFLQVPVVREDSLKDIKKAIREGKDGNAITSDMLIEIMEESIRILWKFIREDKDASNSILTRKRTRVELQDPADSELLKEIRANLQKKEKKLKELTRSGNCILRRFQKHQGDDSDQVLYFFSQVDMRLVARVLNMSRLTAEQLLWCRNKLSNITFTNRKIHLEPSFLLFPC